MKTKQQHEQLQADLRWASAKIEGLYRDVARELRAQGRQRMTVARRLARTSR